MVGDTRILLVFSAVPWQIMVDHPPNVLYAGHVEARIHLDDDIPRETRHAK